MLLYSLNDTFSQPFTDCTAAVCYTCVMVSYSITIHLLCFFLSDANSSLQFRCLSEFNTSSKSTKRCCYIVSLFAGKLCTLVGSYNT